MPLNLSLDNVFISLPFEVASLFFWLRTQSSNLDECFHAAPTEIIGTLKVPTLKLNCCTLGDMFLLYFRLALNAAAHNDLPHGAATQSRLQAKLPLRNLIGQLERGIESLCSPPSQFCPPLCKCCIGGLYSIDVSSKSK